MPESLEVTLEVTQFCDHACWYCSSNASPDGKHLDMAAINVFLARIKDSKISRINISGGEPLVHPEFYKIKKMCDDIVGSKNVYVYTNAIERLVFNGDVIDGVQVHANILIHAGKQIRIPIFAHVIHFLKIVKQGKAKSIEFIDDLPDQEIRLSGNFNDRKCKSCNHVLLQADGKIVNAPCRKDY